MKLLVFAHKPPPRHGQSYAVQLLLDSLGGDVRNPAAPCDAAQAASDPHHIDCYHVDSRLSADMQDIGRAGWRKVLRLLGYCAQAIWCRLRYGVKVFYYIPAPGIPAAVYRDWIVMALCRPFFQRRIYHWHAAGLADWLAQAKPWQRSITLRLVGRPDLSIVLSDFNRRDALALNSHDIVVVPNGIPDPCPTFDASFRDFRRKRLEARVRLLGGANAPESQLAASHRSSRCFNLLFIGLCIRSKGLFDALEAVATANQRLKHRPIRVHLNVAGVFWHDHEKAEFETRINQPDLSHPQSAVTYHGFVSGQQKEQLFRDSDALCFPTYYEAESFGLVLLEAMAYGLPVIATRWRMVPEVLPKGYPGLVDPRSPDQIASAIEALLVSDVGLSLRDCYLSRFTDAHFAENMQRTLMRVVPAGDCPR